MPDQDNERLIRLLLSHQRRIFAYIYTLLPNRHDAEDILQETCVVIHRKFDDFREGTNFFSWACQIAYWKVREFRKRADRQRVLCNQEVFDALAGELAEIEPTLSVRHEALGACLDRMPERDRNFILARYERGGGVDQAARLSGRSMDAAYKALGRVRRALHDCVVDRLSRTEADG
ncbi:sigma-70 family RNA polymerase sigma factor [soil metagenome]